MRVVRVLLLVLGTVAWPISIGPAALGAEDRPSAPWSSLWERLDVVESEARSVDDMVAVEIEPIMDALASRSRDTLLVRQVAVAMVREGRRSGIDPKMLLAVLFVENANVDPLARSIVGAVGLMQVMPFHAGAWGCAGDDLTDPAINICHGTRILAHELSRNAMDIALLRYNGCVRGTNTPDCHLYPSRVLRTLERLDLDPLPPPDTQAMLSGFPGPRRSGSPAR